MHYVYVLQSQKDNNLYIGCTHDVENRIFQHNAGMVRSTKSRRPLKLVYREIFQDKYEAYNVERFYKTAKGKAILKSKIK